MRRVLLVAALVIPGVTAVTASGPPTTPAACHPSYTPCVAIADDVDCANGTANGPVWIDYWVSVHGLDDYGLDDDADGFGCDVYL